MKLPPFRLDRFLDGREDASFNLAGSVCNQRTMSDVLALEPDAQERLFSLPLEYQPYKGSEALRADLAQSYTDMITPEHILITVGAQEALFSLSHVLLSSGDHVIVQTPCYQQLSQLPESLGCHVTKWAMAADGTWDLNALEEAMSDRTRLLVINSPHNPTGAHFTASEFEAIIRMARQHGTYLLSDEVYRYLEHEPQRLLPAAAENYERALSLADMSKTYGAPGTRVGWVVTQDEALLRSILEFKDYVTISGSAVGQFLAGIIIRNRQQLIDENRQLLRDNAARLQTFAEDQAGIALRLPVASTTGFIQFTDGTVADVLAEDAYHNHDILIAPGSKFGDYPHYARVGIGSKSFPTAIEAFETYLEMTHRKVVG